MNKRLHWICVPLIVFSTLALLHSVPFPDLSTVLPPHLAALLNWATLAIFGTLLFYLRYSWTLSVGLLLIGTPLLMTIDALGNVSSRALIAFAVSIFLLAWMGQFIGHRIEGKKPSFLKDLRFLLIGPAWIIVSVYRKLRIPT